MKKPRIGDIVRFTRFHPDGNYEWNAASTPLWGEVVASNASHDFNVIMFYAVGNKNDPRDGDNFEMMHEDGFPISCWVNGHDEWEIVPEDEWPDEICVALAKWRLLNELTIEGE